jgi:cytochrome oxidase assembly protein ShyY1
MLRFLLKPRWIALGLFAVVMAVVCVELGFWQLRRLTQTEYSNRLYRQGMVATPVPAEEILDGKPNGPLLYRHVSATGTYDPAHEVILYGRSSREHRPGNHVLTPLRLPDGRAILVDRGWVPFGDDSPPIAVAAPPTGTVTVTGLLAPTEPGGSPQKGPTTTFTRVDLAQIGRQLPYRLLPSWLELQSQQPAQPGALPELPPQPTLNNGPHLSYAVQWFSFALIAAFGFVLLAVRQVREDRAERGRRMS